ncbi:threonine/serine exporter family protein [Butyricicoccus sp. AM05-1]|uniref:threonine/serine exporter family protein n=1 Tax=Butyricicoccus sp. AM05-1 TaxID=2292004 RepID=UPI002E8E5533
MSNSLLMLGLAAALACCALTFLLGGAWVEMILAFFGTGIGNAVRCKRSKHYRTLVLCTTVSVAAACPVYAGCLKIAEMTCGIAMVKSDLERHHSCAAARTHFRPHYDG